MTGSSNLTKLERDIIRQVEHYFGDYNLARDKFMQRQLEIDGWMSFDVLLTFNRLKALSTDVVVIVDALLKSDLGLLEISNDRRKLRRSPEHRLPQHNQQEVESRTLYVKGFPLATDISELVEFFNAYPKVVHIHLKRFLDVVHTKKYKFDGSVYATFETRAQAKQFIEQEKVLYKGRLLICKWKKA